MANWTWIGQRLGHAVALVVVMSSAAQAQTIGNWTDRAFVNISFGAQPGSRTETVAGSFDLYEEVASFGADLETDGSAMFDFMAGHRVWRNVAAAIGYSTYSDSLDTVLSASIPDPFVFDSPTAVSRPLGNLTHREKAVHVSATYMLPLQDLPVVNRLDVLLFAGPSFFSLTKDVIGGISVTPETTHVSDVAVRRVSESATGAHLGMDVSYRITSYNVFRSIGVGFFIRGASAEVDVAEIQDGKVGVGGLSYGFGARLGF